MDAVLADLLEVARAVSNRKPYRQFLFHDRGRTALIVCPQPESTKSRGYAPNTGRKRLRRLAAGFERDRVGDSGWSDQLSATLTLGTDMKVLVLLLISDTCKLDRIIIVPAPSLKGFGRR